MRIGESVQQEKFLDALNAASGKHISIIMEMLKSGESQRDFVTFTTEGVLPRRRYADVKVTARTSQDTWTGEMACGPNRMHKHKIRVVRNHCRIVRSESGKYYSVLQLQNNNWSKVFDAQIV